MSVFRITPYKIGRRSLYNEHVGTLYMLGFRSTQYMFGFRSKLYMFGFRNTL